ncbi:S41 family peptidase [Uliginosibacterium sp. H3]|uniref:S41 family peptidase n=1 Tax=Uliginosibacterium silvisoli TaxID=3114758 RepID=A0ABU6K7L8_9RHOO|nr:S41 family peptidase [Uliginosibacterium sp. H3]
MSSKFKQFSLVFSGVCIGVLISLNFAARADREVPPSSLPVQELRSLAAVFNSIKQNYVEPVEDKKLLDNAISGMVAGLDPHSNFLDADSFKDLQDSTKGEFGGLGIEVGMEDGFVKVVSPIEDTPAFRAGIKSGDLIVKIDDTPVKGLALNDAVKRMRGKPQTKVVLTVARKGENRPFDVSLTREIIKVQSVRSKLVEPGYGYLRLTQFQEQSTIDLVKHLDRLYKSGPLKGLVLDLRNDPGGLLSGAVGVSAAFLPSKSMVVYTDGRVEDSRHKYFASPEDYARGSEDVLKALPAGVKNVPIVVLVNGGSASASEIVAGALQDYKRATIMGTQTFGKGSVQTIIPLSETTAVKLTTARYYTPQGRSIQAKGITPDVIVEDSLQGSAPVFLREADLERHLINDKDKEVAPAAPKQPAKRRNDDDPIPPPIEFGSKDDYQFAQALNFLKGKPLELPPVAASAPAAAASAPK